MKIFFLGILFVFIIYLSISVAPRFGAITIKHSNTSSSVNYDKQQGKFVNLQQNISTKAVSSTIKTLFDFMFPKNQVAPKSKLPEESIEIEQLKQKKGIQLIWLGHSSILLKANDKFILIDPVFNQSASPLKFFTQRFQPPVISLNELPSIDYILISHDHYDHLDYDTIKHFKTKKNHFIVPLGVGEHLEKWGIKQSRIYQLDWWQDINLDEIRFTCTPAKHFSGRLKPNSNQTLWASWVIKTNDKNIYFSGDSGYGTHFKTIGDTYGPFDLALIENGQYDRQWPEVHMHPEETANSYFDLKAKAMLPIHWGMFSISRHDWFEPIERISKLASQLEINLITPKIGEIVDLELSQTFSQWWQI